MDHETGYEARHWRTTIPDRVRLTHGRNVIGGMLPRNGRRSVEASS